MNLPSMAWAAMFDLSHRLVTCNMIELRNMARRYVGELPAGSRVMDFGCGTGLYAGLFLDKRVEYHGFDIDERFVAYAGVLHPEGIFHSTWEAAAAAGPFDLVMANCCFHHIADADASAALAGIRSVLAPGGGLLFIDHVPPTAPSVSAARKAYRKLERGEHIRRPRDYERLIAPHLSVETLAIERSYVMSAATRFNPLFNELVVMRCGVPAVAT